MRQPVRAVAGNLIWTREGSVWAVWRLSPIAYGFRPRREKDEARVLHQALLRALPGESLLLGVCAETDPASVVERMIAGVDLDDAPMWAAECNATLDTLEEISIGRRTYWLAVPLTTGASSNVAGVIASASENMRDRLGISRTPVRREEIRRRQEQARKIQRLLPAKFLPAEATPAQLVWLHQHALQRGLRIDVALPEPRPTAGAASSSGVRSVEPPVRSGAAFAEPLLDEGGQSDLTTSRWNPRGGLKNPMGRRFLKVSQPDSLGRGEGMEEGMAPPPASYQALLALADVPAEGMLFPGSEFLGRIDESGLEVDWAMRLEVRSSEEVAKKNRRALINLNDQYQQRDDQTAVSTSNSEIDRAAGDLAEYMAVLASDKLEVECQNTIVFAVAAPTAEEALADAHDLSSYFGSAGYRLALPLGGQEDLWWAMMPGAATNQTIRDYAQITTSAALAVAMPLASSELGDAKGPLLGLNTSSGRAGVVHLDIAGSAALDMSGSFAVAGELGAGKSVFLKAVANNVVDRGGQVIAPDRTRLGEWAVWAAQIPDSVVVDVDQPEFSLDPLRIHGPVAGARITQSFLTQLLNLDPLSDAGVAISEALDPNTLPRMNSLGELLDHLHRSPDPAASEVARKIAVFARKDFGRVLFDSKLLVLDITAPAIVIRTHTLELPSSDELSTPHLFDRMRLEKRYGRALYTLIGGLARLICFADVDRLGLFILDEAHHLTSNQEGEEEIKDFVRDGRKHGAAVGLGSHDPLADFGSETLRGLIPRRILMRHTDKNLARNGLIWLDMDHHDPDLVDMVTTDISPKTAHGVEPHRRGEGIMRDASGRIGRIKILLPSLPERRAAVLTTPKDPSAAKQPTGQPAQLELDEMAGAAS